MSNGVKQLIAENKFFLIPYVLFLIAGGILVAIYEKGDDILYINALHTPLLNDIFKWTTLLAELPAFILILLLVVFSGFGNGLVFTLNIGTVFVVVQFLKRVVFADEMRPAAFFEGSQQLNFVPGLEIARAHSFPSGHTAAAFAIFFMLSILAGNRRWGTVLFFTALAVGISRVYLLQHFFRDVYFGSIVGILITFIFYITFTRSAYYRNLRWRDKKLLN